MIALPLQPGAPLATRPATPRAHAPARPEASADAPTADDAAATLDERIAARVDTALAEALAKVKTPADDAVAQQQAAFDRMMQQRAEDLREANAIREFGMAQQKKENDILTEFIRMI